MKCPYCQEANVKEGLKSGDKVLEVDCPKCKVVRSVEFSATCAICGKSFTDKYDKLKHKEKYEPTCWHCHRKTFNEYSE